MNQFTNVIKLKISNKAVDATLNDRDIIALCPSLRHIPSKKFGTKDISDDFFQRTEYQFCFNYAFNNLALEEVEEGYDLLKKNYIPIYKTGARRGDIISFHAIDRIWHEATAENCNHFAIVSKIEKEKIIIKSKWGICGIFEGDIRFLPSEYGNRFIIWRKKLSAK